jgi:hypothetical protein
MPRAEPTIDRSFGDVLRAQIVLLERVADHVDKHGFAVVLARRNARHKDTETRINDQRLFFINVSANFLDDYIRFNARGLHPVIIRANHDSDGKLVFGFVLPRTLRFKPLNVALGMYSRTKVRQGWRWESTGNGFLTRHEFADRYEYRGEGRDQLDIVVRTFAMPIHRECFIKTKPVPRRYDRVA